MSGAIFSLSVTIKFPFLLYWTLAAGYVVSWVITRTMTPSDIKRISGEVCCMLKDVLNFQVDEEEMKVVEPLIADSSNTTHQPVKTIL